MSCGVAAVCAMAAALLAAVLVGTAEGKLISEACQDHCSGTYPEHTYPNVCSTVLALFTVSVLM